MGKRKLYTTTRERVAELRKKGLDHEAIRARLGISKRTLSELLRADRKTPP